MGTIGWWTPSKNTKLNNGRVGHVDQFLGGGIAGGLPRGYHRGFAPHIDNNAQGAHCESEPVVLDVFIGGQISRGKYRRGFASHIDNNAQGARCEPEPVVLDVFIGGQISRGVSPGVCLGGITGGVHRILLFSLGLLSWLVTFRIHSRDLRISI